MVSDEYLMLLRTRYDKGFGTIEEAEQFAQYHPIKRVTQGQRSSSELSLRRTELIEQYRALWEVAEKQLAAIVQLINPLIGERRTEIYAAANEKRAEIKAAVLPFCVEGEAEAEEIIGQFTVTRELDSRFTRLSMTASGSESSSVLSAAIALVRELSEPLTS